MADCNCCTDPECCTCYCDDLQNVCKVCDPKLKCKLADTFCPYRDVNTLND